jgi:hypothetical protein
MRNFAHSKRHLYVVAVAAVTHHEPENIARHHGGGVP